MKRISPLLIALFLALPACTRDEADAAQAPAPTPAPTAPAAAPVTAPAAAPATPPVGRPALPPVAAPGAAASPADDAPLSPDQIPLVVARIDGVEVSRADLLARATEVRGALAERGVRQPPATRSFFRSVLDDIVANRLLFRELTARGLAVPKAEVDARFQEVRGRYESEEQFLRELAQRGFDADRLRSELTEGMTVQRWVQEQVIPKLTVEPAALQEFYDANREQMLVPESVRARHLLVAVPRDADEAVRAEARRKAETLRARVVGGEELAAVAREASDDRGSAERGGELGWIRRGQTVPAFEQAAFSLAPGTLSGLVESPFGIHLILVEEKRPEKQLTFEEAKGEIEVMLRQRALERTVRERVEELAGQAKIEILI